MTQSLRKNTTIKQEDYELIASNAKKRHMSFSEFLCSSAIQRINEDEKMDLFEYLKKYSKPVSKEENKDIEKILQEFDEKENDFQELSVDDVLHG